MANLQSNDTDLPQKMRKPTANPNSMWNFSTLEVVSPINKATALRERGNEFETADSS